MQYRAQAFAMNPLAPAAMTRDWPSQVGGGNARAVPPPEGGSAPAFQGTLNGSLSILHRAQSHNLHLAPWMAEQGDQVSLTSNPKLQAVQEIRRALGV